MSELHRLVYTSVRTKTCTDEEIEKILIACERNNPGRNVTGILVHSDKRFLQYIEGEKEELIALYDLIKEDPRHAGCNIRCLEPIEQRVFPSWEMGYKDVNKEVQFSTHISPTDQRKIEDLITGEMDFSDQGMKLLQLFFQV